MNAAQFVRTIRQTVYDQAVEGTISLLHDPPGRKPSQTLMELADWYKRLSPADQIRVQTIICMASRESVFGMLATIDNVRAVSDSQSLGQLELRFDDGVTSTRINDASGKMMHELFAEQIPPAWHAH